MKFLTKFSKISNFLSIFELLCKMLHAMMIEREMKRIIIFYKFMKKKKKTIMNQDICKLIKKENRRKQCKINIMNNL